ncbi:hypothetical protein ScPMuIL_004260 [Solemya velum]
MLRIDFVSPHGGVTVQVHGIFHVRHHFLVNIQDFDHLALLVEYRVTGSRLLPVAISNSPVPNIKTIIQQFDHLLTSLPVDSVPFIEAGDFNVDNLTVNSRYNGLACKKLANLFSKEFLVPLEETDSHFKLGIEHLNLSRYSKMLSAADYHNNLDLVPEIQSDKGEIHVRPPVLDSDYFNPSNEVLNSPHLTSRDGLSPWKQPWQQSMFDKLELPLPIPHPAIIAVSVYNRENDSNPINLEDVFCQRIIRAIKEIPYANSSDSYDVDVLDREPSTPEHAIDPPGTFSHLAEQELSFTDGDINALQNVQSRPTFHQKIITASNDETTAKIVYSEIEADNSCVSKF